MTIKHKVLVEHKKYCHSVAAVKRGDWTTPWAFLDTTEKRDSIGRRREGGYRRWWHARCNDPDCPGEIVLDETSIFEHL